MQEELNQRDAKIARLENRLERLARERDEQLAESEAKVAEQRGRADVLASKVTALEKDLVRLATAVSRPWRGPDDEADFTKPWLSSLAKSLSLADVEEALRGYARMARKRRDEEERMHAAAVRSVSPRRHPEHKEALGRAVTIQAEHVERLNEALSRENVDAREDIRRLRRQLSEAGSNVVQVSEERDRALARVAEVERIAAEEEERHEKIRADLSRQLRDFRDLYEEALKIPKARDLGLTARKVPLEKPTWR